MKCPQCGKFLRGVSATVLYMGEEIEDVIGFCKTHGAVEPSDWSYEDFFPNGGSYEWWESHHIQEAFNRKEK